MMMELSDLELLKMLSIECLSISSNKIPAKLYLCQSSSLLYSQEWIHLVLNRTCQIDLWIQEESLILSNSYQILKSNTHLQKIFNLEMALMSMLIGLASYLTTQCFQRYLSELLMLAWDTHNQAKEALRV